MSTAQPVARPRQWLSERQSATVNALLDAGLEELREEGFDKLSVRSVAQRAGVTHTTAYSYFTSKTHLVAEIYWRQIRAVPPPKVARRASFVARVRAAFEGPTSVVAAEPSLAHSIMVAMLSQEPDTHRIREQVGIDLVDRLHTALGDYADPDLIDTLLMAYSGAMTIAGTGTQDFLGVIRSMEKVARQIDPQS